MTRFLALMLITTGASGDFENISGVEVDVADRWSTTEGATSFRFITSLMDDLEITVSGPLNQNSRDPSDIGQGSVHRSVPHADSAMPGEIVFSAQPGSALDLWMPLAAWDGFAGGELRHSGRLGISWPGGNLESDGFVLRPTSPEVLELFDDAGNALFRLDYIHAMPFPADQVLTLWNMDMSLTPYLASRMGHPELAGFVVANAFTRTGLDIPAFAETEGSCTSPNWHNGTTFQNDVELSNLGTVQQVARQAGVRVAIAPSATLRNVGTADVPWYEKFTTEPPQGFGDYPAPYSRDQHPFLVWAMYRIVDDIPQQIGQSAVKHAFLTINSGCSCSSGHILWAAGSSPNGQGCADTYGVGNNNNPTDLGIRDEVPSFSGEWEQCGSMFAPGATPPGPCTQTNSGSTADAFERRLVVEESELQTANATYYFEGWYVIRDDINIFNTMAYKQVTPTFGATTWSFPTGVHNIGPAIEAWVPANTRGAMAQHNRESTNDGHYSLAVKVSDLGGGQYRYVYALMNYDVDYQFNSFALEVTPGVNITNIQYLDGDSDAGNNWASSILGGELTFTAPADGELEWGFMTTFVFEADQPPFEGPATLTTFERLVEFQTTILGPADPGQVLKSGFED